LESPARDGALEPRPRPPEDVESGLRVAQADAMETRRRVSHLSASFHAVLDALRDRGLVPADDYRTRTALAVDREAARMRRGALVVLRAEPEDKYALTDLPEIDCEPRLPLCRARCCTLPFALTAQDLDERIARWDYARPYDIARREDGYCVHNDWTRACAIYPYRPASCRTYDCRQDRRIWLDFEKRIPAPEE
jgi:hypothetical protein